MNWLEGKVAVITGGGAGIGFSIVERFIQEGAKVCVLDYSIDNIHKLKQTFGSKVMVFHGDVRNYKDNESVVDLAISNFGKLDIFIGNAGVFDGFKKLIDIPVEVLETAYEELFSVNVKGYLLGAKAALPYLEKSNGNMIFTISGAAFYPDGGGPLYTASKHAALGLIRQLAFESAPNIRVNGVAPGGTTTDLKVISSLKPFCVFKSTEEREASIKSRNPLRMAMQSEDHVGAYVLLASDQSSAITGEVISSDGGLAVRGLS